jgi:hypothetical protein
VAQSHSFQDAILPVARALIEQFDFKVIKFYAPDYLLELADTEPRKEIDEAQVANSSYKEGTLTKNEARRRLGEEPVDGGDDFAAPSAQPGAAPAVNGTQEATPKGGLNTPGKKKKSKTNTQLK